MQILCVVLNIKYSIVDTTGRIHTEEDSSKSSHKRNRHRREKFIQNGKACKEQGSHGVFKRN